MRGEYQPVSLTKVALIGFTIGYIVPAFLYMVNAAEVPAEKQTKSTICDAVEYGVNSGKMTILTFKGMDIKIQPKGDANRDIATIRKNPVIRNEGAL